MRVAAALVAGLVCSAALAAGPVQRTLSFEERVNAQAAIERVYYSHQLGATKPFDEAVPRAVLENKVRKYLEQTVALQTYWKTAVTDDTLQRELERMAQGTRMPERLQELYTALGNDAFLIKECLARPALVDRLTHNFYTFDSTMHGKARTRAEEIHRQLVAGELNPSAEHPNRTVSELVVGETDAGQPMPELPMQQRMSQGELQKQRAELPATPGGVSDVKETPETFAINVILSESTTSFRVASYVIPKTAWDAWWESVHGSLGGASIAAVASASGRLPALHRGPSVGPLASCADDTWDNGSLDSLPKGRALHTAVWTGTVMVIWGGYSGSDGYHYIGLNSGSLYDPATDSFTPTSTVGAPAARHSHTAVWTGSRMIVWGGVSSDGHLLRSGGLYDPETDTWTATSPVGAPAGRNRHTAIWTGRSMVVWGGDVALSPYTTNTGGRYDPDTNTWTATSTVGAPLARDSHSAIWTGSSMIVWGGSRYESNRWRYLDTGGRYDPVADLWVATSTLGAPSGRLRHTAAWTGGLMVVWGGDFSLNTGGRYDPTTDTWAATTTIDAPPGNDGGGHTAIWTGSVMVVWGLYDPTGSYKAGGRYDPVADTWTPTSLVGAPSGRSNHTAVWTGSLMIVWGGSTYDSNTGGRYDPAADTWTPTTTGGAPATRNFQTAAWTGSFMVIWGGVGVDGKLNSGGRYDPVMDTWAATSTLGAPIGRHLHTAVWTGSAMVVWGGLDFAGHDLNTGGRYDPIVDSWTATSTVGAPDPRRRHTAVWTGTRMIVWGGFTSFQNLRELDTGGRYDPTADTWAATSLDSAPSQRSGHTAVWTGSVMVIWGGVGEFPFESRLKTGAVYEPNSNEWSPTSLAGAPSARAEHTAIWTGSEMFVWGGSISYDTDLNTGGRYDPEADTWNAIGGNAPSPRTGHSAVWTGTEMVVWGGTDNTGGIYSPAAGYNWRPTSTVRAPLARSGHSAVWTGNLMVVWGGGYNTGGRYVRGTGVDDDCDRDGFTEAAGDCDDHNASIYPGAPEICDFRNDNCSDPNWPTVPDNETDIDQDGFSPCQGDCDDNDVSADLSDVDQDGFNTCQGDCNDDDASIYPGAPQFCDGLNTDCNDPSWPAVPTDERDADHDGLRGCNGDCDDTNWNVRPGRLDYCDGLDNDCDGVIDNYGDAACNDGNICTDDHCNGRSGCSHASNTSPCEDWNLCTAGDTCGGGICRAGAPIDCNDRNECTDDSCDTAMGCVHVNNTSSCDDGNACTTADTCAGGTCNGGAAPNCEDQNACTADSCNSTTGCVHTDTTVACNDNNPCTGDACDPATGCVFTNSTASCDDGNACTSSDTCAGGACHGTAIVCNDSNFCTTDTCDRATGCVFTSNTNPCNDGNACTQTDVCANGACLGSNPVVCVALDQCHTIGLCDPASGSCSNPIQPNGTVCDDASLCATGETCQSGTCTPAFSGLNEPNPRSNGYYKRLCLGPHSGDQLMDADALCVGQVASTFAGIATVADLCAVLQPRHPNDDPCDRTVGDLMVLALNICRARVCTAQSIDSQCGTNGNVGQSLAESDAILRSASRDADTCAHAKCLDEEINTGRALELNSLGLRREGSAIRLDWRPPYLDDGTGHPSKYHVWRRALGSLGPFAKIGVTTDPTFLDASSGSGAFQYEVTAVMN